MGKSLIAIPNVQSTPMLSGVWCSGNTDAINAVNNSPKTRSEIYMGVAGAVGPPTTVNANATGTARAIRSGKNGVNGNILVSPTNTTAGFYSDNTNSDTIAVADLWGFNFSSTGNPTYAFCATSFTATTDHASMVVKSERPAVGVGSTVAQSYHISGYLGPTVTTPSENIVQAVIRQAATASRLSVYLSANTASGTGSFTLRKGGANGNNTVSIGAGATGAFSDTTHTDSLVSGDLVTYGISALSGALVWTADIVSLTLVNTAGNSTNDIFFSSYLSNIAVTTPNYGPILGIGGGGNADGGTITTETTTKIRHGFDVTVTRFRVNVSTNATTGTSNLKSRNNGANGNLAIAVGSGATGQFEDTTHNDVVHAADDYNWTITLGTANNFCISGGAFTENSTPLPPPAGIDPSASTLCVLP